MKINHHVFYLPPYISTEWSHVAALHMKGTTLVVSLIEGSSVEIPSLNDDLLKAIFDAHSSSLENRNVKKPSFQAPEQQAQFRFGMPIMDNFGMALQHNPAQANSPDIPAEILQKINAIAKIMAPEDIQNLPKAEPHCNCMHCQIARAISGEIKSEAVVADDEPSVSEDDLKFEQWDIQQSGEKLYTVTNKLDFNEKYNVFLGQPVGCTCGKTGCEHILAVLSS